MQFKTTTDSFGKYYKLLIKLYQYIITIYMFTKSKTKRLQLTTNNVVGKYLDTKRSSTRSKPFEDVNRSVAPSIRLNTKNDKMDKLLNGDESLNGSIRYDLNQINNAKSINSLRSQRYQLQEQELLIQNRLKYITLEKQKNKKVAQELKRKYEYLHEVRTKNNQVKSFLQTRNIFSKENQDYITRMKNKHLQEEEEKQKKLQIWKKNHRKLADPIRSLHRKHSEEILEFKKEVEQQNKNMATYVKQMEEEQANKLKTIEINKKYRAKNNHHQKISFQLNRRKEYLKKNDNLLKKLAETQKVVKKHNQKALHEIDRYEEMINTTHRSSRFRTNSISMNRGNPNNNSKLQQNNLQQLSLFK